MNKLLTIDEWIEKIVRLSRNPLFNLEKYLEEQKITNLQKENIKKIIIESEEII